MSKTPQPKVYVVTSGAYSDYRIEAIFSNRRAAKKFVGSAGDSNGRCIETHDLLTSVPDKVTRHHMLLGSSGEVRSRHSDWWPWDLSPKDRRPVVVADEWRTFYSSRTLSGSDAIARGFPFTLSQPSGNIVCLYLDVSGTDEEAVRKSFYDHLAKRKAEAEGIAS